LMGFAFALPIVRAEWLISARSLAVGAL
jgi:hypothetical protein